MDELHFRARDRFHTSWSTLAPLCLGLAGEGALAYWQFGPEGFGWTMGGTLAVIGLSACAAYRSWTSVGAAGITVRRVVGRGRTYPWPQIRWVGVHELKGENGTSYLAHINLTNGRRHSLPQLQHSTRFPDPEFDRNLQRLTAWWEASTDPAARIEPAPRRHRLGPTARALLVALLIIAVIAGIVVLTTN